MENMIDSQPQDFLSLISSWGTKFLVRNNGEQVGLDSLKGKMLGLFFSAKWCAACQLFTPTLIEFYNDISTKQSFEIVFVSRDGEESFKDYFSKMPWLAIAFSDSNTNSRLGAFYEAWGIPLFVLIDENGMVLNREGLGIVVEYGVEGYPFSLERIKELKEIKQRASEEQSVKSLLVSESCDSVISSDGSKVAVSTLVGKNILLYFSAQWYPPCRAFLPKLTQAYQEIKSKDENFEILFISSDRDQSSFDEIFSTMPWLAIPFRDTRKSLLRRTFKVHGMPALIALGPSGQTVNLRVENLILNYGAISYPFTEQRIKDVKVEILEMSKQWRDKAKSDLHDHQLLLTHVNNRYYCDKCHQEGVLLSFRCRDCDFDLHPNCVL